MDLKKHHIGGSRGSKLIVIRNTFVIFIVSGFWHGANWTFIAWGALNAIYFLPLILTKSNRRNLGSVASGKCLPTLRDFLSICVTFGLTVFAWIFFRAEDLGHAGAIISKIFSPSIFSVPLFNARLKAITIVIIVIIFIFIEWKGRENKYAIEKLGLGWKRFYRYSLYYLIIISLYWFSGKQQAFIYFQF